MYKQRIAINLLDLYSDSIIYTGTLSGAYLTFYQGLASFLKWLAGRYYKSNCIGNSMLSFFVTSLRLFCRDFMSFLYFPNTYNVKSTIKV